jgi:hypothetical protein
MILAWRMPHGQPSQSVLPSGANAQRPHRESADRDPPNFSGYRARHQLGLRFVGRSRSQLRRLENDPEWTDRCDFFRALVGLDTASGLG